MPGPTDTTQEQRQVPAERPQQPFDLALIPEDLRGEFALWELCQRQANALCRSGLVPQHLRGNLADCTIVVEMARRLKLNPLMVAQSIYIVHGRPGWAATFMIGMANASGVFRGRIRFAARGEGAGLAVTATATLADTGEDVSTTVSMAMAVADGWAKNDKYKSIPQQMLSYRAATFLVRLYCPEVMLGIQTADEIEDIGFAQEPETPRRTVSAPRSLADLEQRIDLAEPIVEQIREAVEVAPLPARRKAMLDRLRHVGLDSVAADQYGPISKWTDETLRGCEALITATAAAKLQREPGADDDGGEP